LSKHPFDFDRCTNSACCVDKCFFAVAMFRTPPRPGE
jgi:hypothetical protein